MVSARSRVALAAVVLGGLLCPSAVAAVETRTDRGDRFGHSASPTAEKRRAKPFALDLSGQWQFRVGDDLAWADPAFDDSGWEKVQVPQKGGHAAFAEYDGFGWYRLTFTLPRRASTAPLVAALGSLDDADETYLNGQLIGSTGSFPPYANSRWFEQRIYPLPAGIARFGERNVLAVRINDMDGGGGWHRGPVGLYSKDALRSAMYGLATAPVGSRIEKRVKAHLRKQALAVSQQKWGKYQSTLSPGFFHDGDTRLRRVSELRSLAERFGPLRLLDTEVQVVKDKQTGAYVVDTNRALHGWDPRGRPVVIEEMRQDFLYLTGKRKLREVGNKSRYFIDSVESKLEGRQREFGVYLPPSYLTDPDRRYPTVYLLHGTNGGAAEWDVRNIYERVEAMLRERGLAESIVIMPDGESLWYADSSVSPWRSMFAKEMVPYVDGSYRTLATREMRGITGFSMGGQGAFTVGWAHPELFSSITSHMGILDLPPLAGTREDRIANADESPLLQAAAHSSEFLRSFRYFFDACQDDHMTADTAAQEMSAIMTAKQVPHQFELYPAGGHGDTCWVPNLHRSFELHSDNFRRNGLQ